jgi:hypothetical protein
MDVENSTNIGLNTINIPATILLKKKKNKKKKLLFNNNTHIRMGTGNMRQIRRRESDRPCIQGRLMP